MKQIPIAPTVPSRRPASGHAARRTIDFEATAIAAKLFVFRCVDGYGYRSAEHGSDCKRFDDEQGAWQAACYDTGLVARPPGYRARPATR